MSSKAKTIANYQRFESVEFSAIKAERAKIKHEQFRASGKIMLADGDVPILKGYAIVWNRLSSDRGGYRSTIAQGAAIMQPKVRLLVHHDDRLLLGDSVQGTLKITTDNIGLAIEARPVMTSYAKDALELIRTNHIQGMSFGMFIGSYEWIEPAPDGGSPIQRHTRFEVDEITITDRPAFADTTIGIAEQTTQSSAAKTSTTSRFNLHRLDAARFTAGFIGGD